MIAKYQLAISPYPEWNGIVIAKWQVEFGYQTSGCRFIVPDQFAHYSQPHRFSSILWEIYDYFERMNRALTSVEQDIVKAALMSRRAYLQAQNSD